MTSTFSAAPECLRELGEQLQRNGAIVPPVGLYSDEEIFVLELGKIFFSGWTLVDAASLLAESGQRILCDVATRGYILVRQDEQHVNAFRNRCLHAGYPICEAGDAQSTDILKCKFHDWRYGLNGQLTHAPHLPATIDRSTLFLKKFRVQCREGLVFLAPGLAAESVSDGSGSLPDGSRANASLKNRVTDFAPQSLDSAAPWLEHAEIAWRHEYRFERNWKHLQWRLPALIQLFATHPANHGAAPQPEHAADNAADQNAGRSPAWNSCQSYGAFSWIAFANGHAAIFRLIPRSIHETKLSVGWLRRQDADRHGDKIDADNGKGNGGHRASASPLEQTVLDAELVRMDHSSGNGLGTGETPYTADSMPAKFFAWYYAMLNETETD